MSRARVGFAENVVGHHFPDARHYTVLSGGSVNLMVHVTSTTGEHILRVHLHDDQDRFATEIRTLQQLARLSAPTPRVIAWGWRSTAHATPYLIYPALPGVTLAKAAEHLDTTCLAEVVGNIATEAVRCAGRLPASAYGYLHVEEPEARRRGTPHDVDRYRSVIADHALASAATLSAARRAVAAGAALLTTDHPVVVHPDLKPANVLVHETGVSLLDWELPVGGHPLLAYGGLLAEGVVVPKLRQAIDQHLSRLSAHRRQAAITAGLLRALEALSYLATNPTIHNGRVVRLNEHALGESIAVLTRWAKA